MKTREIACQHYKCHGSCDLGKDADFVVVDKDFNVYMTVVNGNVVYNNLK